MAHGGRGLYEQLLTEELQAELGRLDEHLEARRDDLRPAEAADRIALHLGRLVRRAVATLPDAARVAAGVQLARKVVALLGAEVVRADVLSDSPIEPGSVLRAVLGRLPDGSPESMAEPLIPLLDTALLTNAPGEPRVGSQILAEIHSADRIDIVMAFIRRTGIGPMLGALRAHCEAGRAVRVLTTTYTGSTEAKALDQLRDLGASVSISYDVGTTRLHAKAWLFHRRSGFSTAYIGSSNLTHSAQVSGLEWNVRVSGSRNPDVVDKVAAVFESYWNSGDFVPYDPAEFLARQERAHASGPDILLSPIELRLEPFQERLLEQIAVARELGHHRNLLVSATGTGKTVMAAADYAALRRALPRDRLLFVAHREEILAQSLATFRHALRDHAFGELWVGGRRPDRFEHVFASIQSLHAAGLASLARDHFDVVILDEFHHAAAPPSTRRKLSLLQLAEELGNVAKACKIMGYHRDTFYEVKRAFQVGGVAGLVEKKRGPRQPHPNRLPEDVERKILDYSLRWPTHGPQRVANQLRLEAINVSAGGVRGVWLRHDLETRHKRLMRLERESRQNTFVLSPEQVALLERHSTEFRLRHVEASRPGELLNQDTFYWGTIKGVGNVYVQVVVDVFCSFAFAKVYTSKMPITAADLLHDKVLPFYEALGVPVGAVLTDNGREFCGLREQHPYELLLAVEGIRHRTTKVPSPRTNGFVERMNRTLLDECFRIGGRTKWYATPEELQTDLDAFLVFYNFARSHQGYRLAGRTPAEALFDGIGLRGLRLLPPAPEEALMAT